MAHIPDINEIRQMGKDELDRANRELEKELLKRILIFAGVKLAILLIIRKAFKSAND